MDELIQYDQVISSNIVENEMEKRTKEGFDREDEEWKVPQSYTSMPEKEFKSRKEIR